MGVHFGRIHRKRILHPMSYNPSTRFSQSFQTTNATPTVAYSVPMPEGSAAFIQIDFIVSNSGYTLAAAGEADAAFTRASAGNVLRATGSNGLLAAAIKLSGNFAPMPQAEIVANTTSQTADIRLSGITATTLNWVFTVNTKRIAL